MINGSLESYAVAKGLITGKPRTILPFHKQIFKAFQQLMAEDLPKGAINLGICMPPSHGKTMTVQEFVEYSFGLFPDSQFIYASYGLDLAVRSSKPILNTISSDWYKSLFGREMFNKSCMMQGDQFTTAHGGGLKAVGVGGPITGFRAGQKREGFSGAIIYDDLLKASDARSQTVRNSTNTWHFETASSRVNRAGIPKICICQRLHLEDIVGYLQDKEKDLWHWLVIPAINELGEVLWPEVYSQDMLDLLRKGDEHTFYAQYQQYPQLLGGNMIKSDWWQYHDWQPAAGGNPPGMLFITADTAYKVTKNADASTLQLWSATQTHLDLLAIDSGRWEFPDLLTRSKDLYEAWKKHQVKAMFIENKASGASLEQTLRSQNIPAIAWNPGDYKFPDDKVARVRESLWYILAGRVRLPKYINMQNFIDECSAFSEDMSQSHDDMVDGMTMAVSIWRYYGGGLDVQKA